MSLQQTRINWTISDERLVSSEDIAIHTVVILNSFCPTLSMGGFKSTESLRTTTQTASPEFPQTSIVIALEDVRNSMESIDLEASLSLSSHRIAFIDWQSCNMYLNRKFCRLLAITFVDRL